MPSATPTTLGWMPEVSTANHMITPMAASTGVRQNRTNRSPSSATNSSRAIISANRSTRSV